MDNYHRTESDELFERLFEERLPRVELTPEQWQAECDDLKAEIVALLRRRRARSVVCQMVLMSIIAESLAIRARAKERNIGQLELRARALGDCVVTMSKDAFRDLGRPKASLRFH